jgi:hypothetical protein
MGAPSKRAEGNWPSATVYQMGDTVATTETPSPTVDFCPYCREPLSQEAREAIDIVYGHFEFPKHTFSQALLGASPAHTNEQSIVLALLYALDVSADGLMEAARHYGHCDG